MVSGAPPPLLALALVVDSVEELRNAKLDKRLLRKVGVIFQTTHSFELCQEIVTELTKASTGNVADAVDEATGQRGFMYHDMKPVFNAKIMGPATTAVMRRDWSRPRPMVISLASVISRERALSTSSSKRISKLSAPAAAAP